MDIKQLRYFAGVIESKSFTKAADKLRIAQPALGLQIRKLEEELETQLLIRHSRGVEPTEAGLLLLARAEEILELVTQAKQELLDFAGPPRGQIVLGLTPSMSLVLAGDLIRMCADQIPLVKLSLVEELSNILFEWVRDDRLDLTLAFNVEEAAGLRSDPLLRETLFFVESPGRPSESRPDTISFAEVARTPLLLPAAPHALRRVIDRQAEQLGLELNIAIEMHSAFSMKDLVAQGVASTVLPFGAVDKLASEGRVVARRIVEPELTRILSLVYSDRRPLSKGEKVLIQILRDLIEARASVMHGIWLPVAK